jgi:hypothetical protein
MSDSKGSPDRDFADGKGDRYNKGKLKWSLLPGSFVQAIVAVLTDGAKKYAPYNWARGMSWSGVSESMRRHWEAFWLDGERYDPESGHHHLAHMACNIMFLFIYDLFDLGDDDRHPVLRTPPKPISDLNEQEQAQTLKESITAISAIGAFTPGADSGAIRHAKESKPFDPNRGKDVQISP